MLLSIIIPCYNVEKYIASTLDSILKAQQDFDYEIIAVDDGSTDNTPSILEEYQTSYPKHVKYVSQKNSGVSSARNKGLDMAHGQYVYFLDGDDMVPRNILYAWVRYAIDNDSGICFGNYKEIIDCGNGEFKTHKTTNFEVPKNIDGISALRLKYERKMWICTGSALYRRCILTDNEIQYRIGLKYGEDALFIATALLYSKIVSFFSQTVLHVRVRAESAMTTITFSNYFDTMTSFRFIVNEAKKLHGFNALKQVFESEYIVIYLSLVKILFKSEDCFPCEWRQKLLPYEFPENNRVIGLTKKLELMLLRRAPRLYYHLVKVYGRLR